MKKLFLSAVMVACVAFVMIIGCSPTPTPVASHGKMKGIPIIGTPVNITGTNSYQIPVTNTVYVPVPAISLTLGPNANTNSCYFIGNEIVQMNNMAIVGNLTNVVLLASITNNYVAGNTNGGSYTYPSAYLPVQVITYLQANTGTNTISASAN